MLKVFCVYNKKSPTWNSDCIIPIQSGCSISNENLGFLRDDIGDNISHKNKNFAEMTAWYWVWKNYLPQNNDVEYIGFCHYRRFFNFSPKKYKSNWNRVYFDAFSKIFKKYYHLENVKNFLDADIILPKINNLKTVTLRESYDIYHPTNDMEKLIEITLKHHPNYHNLILDTLNEKKGYFCLNFIMKKSFFISFMEWVFPLLDELEKTSDWSKYEKYEDIRTPAYLIERFFNIWLNIQKIEHNPSISEMKSIILVNKPCFLKRLVRPFLFLVPKNKRKIIKKNWYN